MDRRNIHTGKSSSDRERYVRYIKKTDYEPTVDERISLGHSDLEGEEFQEPTSKRKRKISTKEKLLDHFGEHWVEWLVTIALGVLYFLMSASKIDITRIEGHIESHKEKISNLETDSKNQNKTDHDQDLQINENLIRISNLEDKVNK